jgi:NAD(P)-dependent dehydrogenase (short-subunit alcohol dehydrogenase family)
MTTDRPLPGRVAIVTGASHGLGRRMAEVLAGAGIRVVAVSRQRPDSALEEVVVEIERSGGIAVAFAADVGREVDARRIAEMAVDRFGRIDILINNAATRLSTKLLDTTPSELEALIRTNVLGPFHMWRHVVPVMLQQGQGNVINVISTNAPVQPFPGMAPYRMSKVALTFLSVDLASELNGSGVAVNAFDPGPVASEGTASIRKDRERRYGAPMPYHAQDPVSVLDAPILWIAAQTGDSVSGRILRRVEFGETWGPMRVDDR